MAHNIVWSTTYTELDLEVFSEALGVFVPSYNARLELSPNGRVWLFFGDYQAKGWEEFEDDCTKILGEVKDVILDIVSEYYEEATSTTYIESQLEEVDSQGFAGTWWLSCLQAHYRGNLKSQLDCKGRLAYRTSV